LVTGPVGGRGDRERLAEIMAWMATGDEAAAVALYREFGDPIRKAAARRARNIGATYLTADDIDAMALDFCLDLVGRAGGWNPGGGALPWVWGRRLLHAVVDRMVGRYHLQLDPGSEPEDPGIGPIGQAVDDDRSFVEVLEGLGRRNPLCALLRRALERVTSPRDRDIFLQYADCRAGHDPSPSHTLAARHGLTPAAVRKVVQRVRRRILTLAEREPEFAPLADLPVLSWRRAA
jgi:hypothetical protein